jgi:glycosidase
LSHELGRGATLDDLPDADLDRLAEQGFDLVWLLGVWQTGAAGRRVSAANDAALEEYRAMLPDFTDDDVSGSPFAVHEYRVSAEFGGDAALERLRERLAQRHMRLMLDFVPNHVAPDHPWVDEHPEYFIEGTEELLAEQPWNWTRIQTTDGPRILAHGRDPYFAGWADTLQLNYGNARLRDGMVAELRRISRQCDALRCDMAMLVLPDVFWRTWGISSEPFWPRAIDEVRSVSPGFLFMAEVYWDLEWELQQQGFDYAYDKRLYDRLREGHAGAVRDHLSAGLDYQDRLARFLENHDEPRAAATFELEQHRAAAVITYLTPGLRFFHQGQLQGNRVHIPMHLRRGPVEAANPLLEDFYDSLLGCLRQPTFRQGEWRLLEALPAWDGNPTNDDFICFAWTGATGSRALVAVNYSGQRSQCVLPAPWPGLSGRAVVLRDVLGEDVFERDGSELLEVGLFLELEPFAYHVFEVEPAA